MIGNAYIRKYVYLIDILSISRLPKNCNVEFLIAITKVGNELCLKFFFYTGIDTDTKIRLDCQPWLLHINEIVSKAKFLILNIPKIGNAFKFYFCLFYNKVDF